MISVLIPTYSCKCYKLVVDLQIQFQELGCEYEIIVAEDGSKDQVSIIHNHLINDLPNCHHLIRRQNIGRAAIRNYLASVAKGDWVLYIDSDAKVVTDDFIQKYLSAITEQTDIIVGGLVNPARLPSPEVTLRFTYEKAAEYQRPASFRQQYPYNRFSTFNVMMRRDAILAVPFDEQCKDYGWEDFLLGKEMERAGKSILHIDNPLMHVGFERNEQFLRKTEQSLHTLSSLSLSQQNSTRIGQMASNVKSLHLSLLVRMLFSVSRPFLRKNLLGLKPKLSCFAFYKLGYFLSI